MSFERPALLVLALAGVALAAWLYRRFETRRNAQALVYSSLPFALEALRSPRWPGALLFAAFVVGTAAELAAVASPRVTTYVPTTDGTVMICIDTSGSMRAFDLSPNRWIASKEAARAFVDAVPQGTRVGVVTFSSDALLIAPPTADRDAVDDAIDRIPPPDGATAIGDALRLAARQMPASGRRIIVLLTDGVNNRGVDPVQASGAIGAQGITIETVGIGTADSGEIIPGTNELAGLDTNALEAIAQNGHGEYVTATDSDQLRSAFRAIALHVVWEKRRIDASFPVAFGGGLVLLLAFLGGLFSGRFP